MLLSESRDALVDAALEERYTSELVSVAKLA